jgi:hypothetical protein
MRFAPLFLTSLVLSAPAARGQTIVQFDGDISTQSGPGRLSYFNGATTSAAVGFGTASGFGLPALPGGDAQVMSIPAFGPTQGLFLRPGTGPNGGGSYINQYTMGFDILFPNSADPTKYASFFNTNETNANDGDFFRLPTSSGGGIGISGVYDGTVNTGTWYRIGLTVDLANGGTLKKYINGTLVGTQTGIGGADGRFALYSENDAPTLGTILFGDNDGDTLPAFVNSFLYSSEVLSDAQIAVYGGPTAVGFTPVPEPSALALLAAAAGGLVCRRRRPAVA